MLVSYKRISTLLKNPLICKLSWSLNFSFLKLMKWMKFWTTLNSTCIRLLSRMCCWWNRKDWLHIPCLCFICVMIINVYFFCSRYWPFLLAPSSSHKHTFVRQQHPKNKYYDVSSLEIKMVKFIKILLLPYKVETRMWTYLYKLGLQFGQATIIRAVPL